MADFFNYHRTSEKLEKANYSLDDFKRFLSGMQEVVGQAERNQEKLEEALQENLRLATQLVEYKNELDETKKMYKSNKERITQLESENSSLKNTVEKLRQIRIEIRNTDSKMKKDGENILDILLQAYKELDIEAMKQFEIALSALNDDSDHRFQQQLDCFRKVRREKAKEKKQASVMNIDNRGGNAFLYNRMDDTKFSQMR